MMSLDKTRGARSEIRSATGFAKIAAACLIGLTLAGCEHLDQKPEHAAGWSLLEPSQRHPILVSQQPHNMNVRIGRGQSGMSSQQRADFYNFLTKYRAQDGGNSKIVISVPAGSSNEVAAMHAVADMRPMLNEQGFSESTISIEPYHAEGDHQPPIRVSYLRYVAEGPECGRWPENLTESKRNLNYHNFGCAQQRNLAAQIANPADLLGPRTMTPSSAKRRDDIYDKYVRGASTAAGRTTDERANR